MNIRKIFVSIISGIWLISSLRWCFVYCKIPPSLPISEIQMSQDSSLKQYVNIMRNICLWKDWYHCHVCLGNTRLQLVVAWQPESDVSLRTEQKKSYSQPQLITCISVNRLTITGLIVLVSLVLVGEFYFKTARLHVSSFSVLSKTWFLLAVNLMDWLVLISKSSGRITGTNFPNCHNSNNNYSCLVMLTSNQTSGGENGSFCFTNTIWHSEMSQTISATLRSVGNNMSSLFLTFFKGFHCSVH